jgi:hypothetical protein
MFVGSLSYLKILTQTLSHSVEQIITYYQHGSKHIVRGWCTCLQAYFCTALTVVALGLHVQIQYTQPSIIELCYLTSQIVLTCIYFLTCILFDTQIPKRRSIAGSHSLNKNVISTYSAKCP